MLYNGKGKLFRYPLLFQQYRKFFRKQIFSDSPLDRCNNQRDNSNFLKNCFENPFSKIIIFKEFNNLIQFKKSKPFISWKSLKSFNEYIIFEGEKEELYSKIILLGILKEENLPCFALEINSLSPNHSLLKYLNFPIEEKESIIDEGEIFIPLRNIVSNLSIFEASILSHARGFIIWHTNNSFCSKCGGKMISILGGIQKKCLTCKTSHYPRTDPAVIMLIFSGNKCLLGRKSIWNKGRYSTLAGFLEPGESIEDAVRREVYEETGIEVADVLYFSSQPWPFPSSLMIGCFGKAKHENIQIDKKELEDARWFDINEIKEILNNNDNSMIKYNLPSSFAISYQLIKFWAYNNKKINFYFK